MEIRELRAQFDGLRGEMLAMQATLRTLIELSPDAQGTMQCVERQLALLFVAMLNSASTSEAQRTGFDCARTAILSPPEAG